jgi:hypothetical protein
VFRTWGSGTFSANLSSFSYICCCFQLLHLCSLFRLLGSRSVLRNCPMPFVVASGHLAPLASPLFCVTHGADLAKFTSLSPARGVPPHAGRSQGSSVGTICSRAIPRFVGSHHPCNVVWIAPPSSFLQLLDRLTFSYLRKSFYFLPSRYHVCTSCPTYYARIGPPSCSKAFKFFRGAPVCRLSCC